MKVVDDMNMIGFIAFKHRLFKSHDSNLEPLDDTRVPISDSRRGSLL